MKNLFRICVVVYQFGPLIIFPYFAYHFDNWYLLFGILFSWLGSFSVFNFKSYMGIFLILAIITWIRVGFNFHQYVTFFFFSSLFGYIVTTMAESYDQESKKGTLENDAERSKFMKANPDYLKDQMKKWQEQNPGQQITYDVIDALAKGKISL